MSSRLLASLRPSINLTFLPRGGRWLLVTAYENLAETLFVAVHLVRSWHKAGQSLCDGCPQLVEADIRALGRHSGFDPLRKSDGPKCCNAQHGFSTMW
jgi:hypothetical protein